jgi:hypothetical protein
MNPSAYKPWTRTTFFNLGLHAAVFFTNEVARCDVAAADLRKFLLFNRISFGFIEDEGSMLPALLRMGFMHSDTDPGSIYHLVSISINGLSFELAW